VISHTPALHVPGQSGAVHAPASTPASPASTPPAPALPPPVPALPPPLTVPALPPLPPAPLPAAAPAAPPPTLASEPPVAEVLDASGSTQARVARTRGTDTNAARSGRFISAGSSGGEVGGVKGRGDARIRASAPRHAAPQNVPRTPALPTPSQGDTRAARSGFGAVKSRVRPAAAATPPPMKPMLESVRSEL